MDELLVIVGQVIKKELTPYEDDALDTPLITKELKEVDIIKTEPIAGIDAKMFTLNNGARVVIMPTEFSKDEILFNAYSFGGSSLLNQEDLPTAELVTTISGMSGIGDYSSTQLKKKLTGKLANVKASLGNTTESFSGSASPKDFETMLQLLYFRITSYNVCYTKLLRLRKREPRKRQNMRIHTMPGSLVLLNH